MSFNFLSSSGKIELQAQVKGYAPESLNIGPFWSIQ